MRVNLTNNGESIPYKGTGYNVLANIESNILLNKGITDIGGFVIPQAVMSNNKDEAIERVFKSFLYFGFTFLSPFVLLPLINKHNLKTSTLLKNLNNDELKILEVSKKYLTKDAEYMKNGFKTTAKDLFGDENRFNSVLEKYSDHEKLRTDLIKAHCKILGTDFISTNLMVASIPWLGNALTKYRTKRSGYSGTYNLADEEFTMQNAKKHDKSKSLRQICTLASALIPGIIIPMALKKGMLAGNCKSGNRITDLFNKNAQKFDYKNAIFMSRAMALTMWITSDYIPYQLACRDKYELKDNTIRGGCIGLVFWGGDLVLKKLFAKTSDRLFGTKMLNKTDNSVYSLKQIKDTKTRKAAAALYFLNLLLVTGTLGFGLPAILNKILKKNVEKDKGINKNFFTNDLNSYISSLQK